jgi:hypothetical protein
MSHMMRLAVILGFTLSLGGSSAQVESRKVPSPSNQVEVRFVDGSTVRMELLQENLEVATRYGKLTVPCIDIRHVEFGLHLSDAIKRRVQEAIARLASKVHAEREAASKDLVLLGYQAYPALQVALKNPDSEVSRRAEEAIKLIRDKVAPHLLRNNENDRLETVEFPIAGRIISATLRAKSAYFVDREIKIADIYAIHSVSAGGRYEVTIDAAKYGHSANQWMDTGIELDAHQALAISASGQVDLWQDGTGQYMTGPAGYKQQVVVGFAGGARAGIHPGGTLLARLGEGEAFVIGENYQGRASRQGRLYLQIAPSPWGNPSVGSYKVKITAGTP